MTTAREDLDAEAAALVGTNVDPTPAGADYRRVRALRVTQTREERVEGRTAGCFTDVSVAPIDEAARAALTLRMDQATGVDTAAADALLTETEASEVVADSAANAAIVISRLES